MERLGLLGGTFDPPHVGHLILASVVADALGLDQIWFVPAADPPHKQAVPVTLEEHRLAMVQLVTDADSRFELSRLHIERPGPHYSVDMVAAARSQRPDADFFFLMGSDSLADVPSWHDPQRFILQCQLAVLERPRHPINVEGMEAQLPGIMDRVWHVKGPSISLSASQIRERVRTGRSIRYLVTPEVQTYIEATGLYG